MAGPFDTIEQNGWLGFPPELQQKRGTLRGRSVGPAALWQRQGIHVPTAQQAANDPRWGLDNKTRFFDESDQFSNPSAASEAIEQFDLQRCIAVDPADITPEGVAFEILHRVVAASHVAVVERIPTIFKEVTSLDAAGVPYFTHGNLNGQRPCVDAIPHAEVGTPLTWRWFFTWVDHADAPPESSTGAYLGPMRPDQVIGEHVIPSWNDLKYGHNANQGSIEQFIFPPGCQIRTYVALFGPTDRFRVQVGGRIVGFSQSCGRKGAALASVLRRHV